MVLAGMGVAYGLLTRFDTNRSPAPDPLPTEPTSKPGAKSQCDEVLERYQGYETRVGSVVADFDERTGAARVQLESRTDELFQSRDQLLREDGDLSWLVRAAQAECLKCVTAANAVGLVLCVPNVAVAAIVRPIHPSQLLVNFLFTFLGYLVAEKQKGTIGPWIESYERSARAACDEVVRAGKLVDVHQAELQALWDKHQSQREKYARDVREIARALDTMYTQADEDWMFLLNNCGHRQLTNPRRVKIPPLDDQERLDSVLEDTLRTRRGVT